MVWSSSEDRRQNRPNPRPTETPLGSRSLVQFLVRGSPVAKTARATKQPTILAGCGLEGDDAPSIWVARTIVRSISLRELRMARVPWSRHSGDDVELAIAIMLSRQNPGSQRIRPSQGDKGIDILVPVETGVEVYQVKSYTGRIDSTRRKHIKQSWNRLQQYRVESGLPVVAWHLIMPEDPTTGDLDWFKELTRDADCLCTWKGLDFVEGLAAAHPEVIDYIFRDGKGRLETKIEDLMAIVGFGTRANEVHIAAEFVELDPVSSSLPIAPQLEGAPNPPHSDHFADTQGAPEKFELLTSSKLEMIDQRANRYKGRIFRVEPTELGQAMGDSYIVTRDRGLPIAAGTTPGDTLRFQVRARDRSDDNALFYVYRIHCDGHLADALTNQELLPGTSPLNATLEGTTFFLECRGTYGEMITGFVDDNTPDKEFNTIWRLVSIQRI